MSGSDNLLERLAEQARLRPDSPALIEGAGAARRVLSFAALEARVTAGHAALRHAGLRPGDSALLLAPVTIDLYVALLALLRLGGTAVFADPSAGRDRLWHCLSEIPPRALLGSFRARLLRRFWAPLRSIPLAVPCPLPDPPRGAQPDARPEPVAPDFPALVTFTSGSTGLPKAIARSHRFLLAQHRALEQGIALEAGETDLVTLPVFLLANLASGVCSVLPASGMAAPGAADPAPLLEQITRERVDRTAASPALLERLARHAAAHHRELPGLRKIFTGGAPVFPRVLDRLRELAPRARIVAVYGSSEAEPIAHLDASRLTASDRAAMRDGAGLPAGRPEPGVDLRILRIVRAPLGEIDTAAFDALCLQTGFIGEIVVAGDHVLTGYLHGRGDAETKIRCGGRVWHRTGDAGRLDADGHLWLQGRVSALIERGDHKLFPFGVECAASEQAGVFRSALVRHGGHVVLVVQSEPGSDREDIARQLHAQLGWARLDRILFMDAIPVDARHNAKVDYPALERLLGRRGFRDG